MSSQKYVFNAFLVTKQITDTDHLNLAQLLKHDTMILLKSLFRIGALKLFFLATAQHQIRHSGLTILTTKLVQGLLRIRVSVTALANVTGFQLNGGLDRGDWLLAGLQVHAGKQGQAASARLILDSLIKS